MTEPVVDTQFGRVAGRTQAKIHSFKGMRYAAAPTGSLRFQPPVPPPAWSGTFAATTYGPSCPQPFGQLSDETLERRRREIFDLYGMPTQELVQDEDCLVLNVWTPSLGGSRPVMVRIHGGGYVMGSGSWSWHDGTNLCKLGDVVVVTLNHRLGLLGYLNLGEALGLAYASSGNAGMLDIVAALEWVQTNIAEFGGDPGNVTVFGESGGGSKISTLLAMPSARGLFHRAIVQSGPALEAHDPSAAGSFADLVIHDLGLEEPARDLSQVPVARLLDAQRAAMSQAGAVAGGVAAFGPVLQPDILPMHPRDALFEGSSSEVPLLIGTVRHEATMFLAMESLVTGQLPSIDADALSSRVTALVAGDAERAKAIVETYQDCESGATPYELLAIIQSDHMMRLKSVELAQAKARSAEAPVFMYLLEWKSPALGGRLMATHGLCVPLSMANVESAPMAGDYPESQSVADQMSEAWVSFARNGNPGHPGLPVWEPHEPTSGNAMIFDVASREVANPYEAELRVWQQ